MLKSFIKQPSTSSELLVEIIRQANEQNAGMLSTTPICSDLYETIQSFRRILIFLPVPLPTSLALPYLTLSLPHP